MPRRTGRVHWKYWNRMERRKVTRKRYPAQAAARGWIPRAYGDFRDFRDVGGGLEALIPPSERRATTDHQIAEKLALDRLRELQDAKRNRVIRGISRTARLGEFAAEHLEAKARTEDVTWSWLDQAERHLRTAVDFFGDDRELTTIRPPDVRAYVQQLKRLPDGRGGTLSNGTVRHYLNSLSNMFRRAVAEEVVTHNPVAALVYKPAARRREARWLEVDEAALFLEAARTYTPSWELKPIPFAYPLIATFLLTGGRQREVLGLQVEDVSFDRKTVTFRPNEYRRLKTRGSHRAVPLWPQLEGVLRAHVFDRDEPLGNLLFPTPRMRSGERTIRDVRKLLDAVGERAGFEHGSIRTKIFRHTYCAARLQTLDRGVPVAPFTVARELGHSGTAMVERVYAHLGQVRHRSEVVEYRVDAFADELGARLTALRARE